MPSHEEHDGSESGLDPNIGDVPGVAPTAGTVKGDVVNVARGFCMGAADTVPGVSGGTVALVLGHYQRLITAISNIDSEFVSLVLSRKFAAAFDHVDGRFLVALGAGIATGIVTLAGLMHWLLDHRMPQTFAVFFGLILASVVVVRRYVGRWTLSCYVACAVGAVVAYGIGQLSHSAGGSSLGYLFLSASIAICAMILPGISGAFVLLLLGVYHDVTGMIKDMAKGINIDVDSITQLGVFACGCLFGLLAFSRLLRWLLEHHQSTTMAALIGLMIGSVRKLWPLQMPTPETASLKMKERVMEVIPPSEWPGSIPMLILLAVGAAVAVIFLERVASDESVG